MKHKLHSSLFVFTITIIFFRDRHTVAHTGRVHKYHISIYTLRDHLVTHTSLKFLNFFPYPLL